MNSLGVVTIILGSLFSVIVCLSLVQMIYKCLLHIKTYWCTCHDNSQMDNIDRVTRKTPRPIAHSSRVKLISKRAFVSHSAIKTHQRNMDSTRKHFGYLYSGNYSSSEQAETQEPSCGEQGVDGDVDFLDKISSSSSSDVSDYLECYSSQSPNTYTLWE